MFCKVAHCVKPLLLFREEKTIVKSRYELLEALFCDVALLLILYVVPLCMWSDGPGRLVQLTY